MTIAQTRFWIDRDSRSIGIRSSSHWTQPFECYLNKHLGLLDFNIYQTGSESARIEYRLSFRFLWLSADMLLRATSKPEPRDDKTKAWGWHFMDRRSFVWRWGHFYKNFDLPFVSLVFLKHELLSLSRKRVVYIYPRAAWSPDECKRREEIQERITSEFPYRYELLTGECQDVTAKVNAERRTWRWKWTPFKHIQDTINIQFSEEVGAERGSWKGGCTGCGYNLRKGESVVGCLRRMERERRFER